MRQATVSPKNVKSLLVIFLLCGLVLSACSLTQTPSPLDEIATAQAIQMQLPLASGEKPTVICYGDFESAIWHEIRELLGDVNTIYGDSVVIAQANASHFEGQARFENLNLEQYPACLVYNDERQEIFRTYDNFSIEAIEPLLSEQIDK